MREAEQVFLQVLAARDVLKERPHLDTAVLSNVGMLYRDLGNLPKADYYLSECVAIRRKELGENHARVALAIAKLAQVQEDEGDFLKAEASLRESLAIRQKLFGPTHAYVARTLLLVTAVERKEGRNAEAQAGLNRAEAIWRQAVCDVGGAAIWYYQQALLWAAEGQCEPAEGAMRQCLEDWRALLGEHDLSVPKTQLELTRIMVEQQHLAEARRMVEAVFPMTAGTTLGAESVRRETTMLLAQCQLK